MQELAFTPALELAAHLRSGRLSPPELVEATLRRIEEVDPALGAFVDVDGDRALEQAQAVPADDRRAFAGVPIAVKANTPVEGLVMDMGSRLLAGYRAGHDAYLVRRLRDAGFVVIGTTKLPEFGILPTTEPRLHGPARNPWNLERTPGGSSGGSAAAVAAGLLSVAHANDGGGSIRIPAACCGLVGLKPSRGRVSRGPDMGDSFLGVDGVVSRTVSDTAALLDVMSGYEVGDATWVPRPRELYSSAVRRDPGPLRIGVTTANPIGAAPHALNANAVRETADLLATLGHDVVEVTPELPGPETLELFVAIYAANIGLGVAFGERIAGRAATEEDAEPLSLAFREIAQNLTAIQLLGATTQLQAIARKVVALWADFDVLLTPALAERPPAIGTVHGWADPPLEGFGRASAFAPYAGLFNVTGQPALSLPAGLGDDGLPLAVQLVGESFGEARVLGVAERCEQVAGIARRSLSLG